MSKPHQRLQLHCPSCGYTFSAVYDTCPSCNLPLESRFVTPSRGSASKFVGALGLVALLLALGEVLVFGVGSMEPEILDSSFSVHAGRWMVNFGILTYVIGVFWICGQKLSLWGYLWRGVVVVIAWAVVDEWIAEQMGSRASVFVSILLLAAIPWIGAWMSWRYERVAS